MTYMDTIKAELEAIFADVDPRDLLDTVTDYVEAKLKESWKNGIAAGRARAASGKRPRCEERLKRVPSLPQSR